MKAFLALVHREFIEHRGAFFIAPMILVGLVLVLTVLAFSVGRIDTRFTGDMLSVLPASVLFIMAVILGLSWGLYLFVTLFFYCADGFSADKRNNAMLFWKSMPVSDFRVLLSKLVAAITILPGAVFGIVLLSMALMLVIAQVTMMFSGLSVIFNTLDLWTVFWNVALIEAVQLVTALLWYLPFMALVGAMGTVVGRWAIPGTILLPVILSMLEWVTFGGRDPLATSVSEYIGYRLAMPETALARSWTEGDFGAININSGIEYARQLITVVDWLQVGIGAVFAVAVIYLASEYRRRASAN
jgi:ABC-2 type transport system permease protein